ncbi:MAG: hypothetical protein CMK09_06160 [Ponticaulis sp.]|nr:hypothetical protein [Ponticaulis sp.]|tara:strand:+ start:103 stop:588 length:486 start_codon:yes stop_codon:yes gene_type:complete
MHYNLAELNVGRLVAPTDDPRVKDFMDNIDFINGLGKQMPGFVWMMEGSGEPGTGNTEAAVGGDPQFVSNLTVWRDVESLERFVWGTVHKKIYERRAEWFELMSEMHFVMWWVPEGHEPTLEEALEKLELRRTNGDTDEAFGWDYLKEAKMHRAHGCRSVA